jgi:endonuclease YncB( thermonuclease family)
MTRTIRWLLAALSVAAAPPLAVPLAAQVASRPDARRGPTAPEASPSVQPQPRPHGTRVRVDPRTVAVDDGDTVVIRWPGEPAETVRILGIDTPETRHPEHDIPYGQELGEEAAAFARGAFAAAPSVELLRAATLDRFGRTLGYVFLGGRNYSVLVLQARLAQETVTHFGDNGLPREAAEVLAAARQAGPPRFESPFMFRARMRDLSVWLKERGLYPPY